MEKKKGWKGEATTYIATLALRSCTSESSDPCARSTFGVLGWPRTFGGGGKACERGGGRHHRTCVAALMHRLLGAGCTEQQKHGKGQVSPLFEEFMILVRRIYDGEGLPLREGEVPHHAVLVLYGGNDRGELPK